LLLRGDGHGNFTAVPGQVSGLEIYGDQRGAAVCDYDKDGRVDIAVSQNGTVTKLYHNETARSGLRVVLAGAEGNPAGFGAQMRLVYAGGQGPAREVHGGGGYWSQDGAAQVLGKSGSPSAVWIRWPGGKTFSYPLTESTTELVVDPSGKASAATAR